MAAQYVTLGHVDAALERLAARHAAIDTLHREQLARAAEARPDPPAPTEAGTEERARP